MSALTSPLRDLRWEFGHLEVSTDIKAAGMKRLRLEDLRYVWDSTEPPDPESEEAPAAVVYRKNESNTELGNIRDGCKPA